MMIAKLGSVIVFSIFPLFAIAQIYKIGSPVVQNFSREDYYGGPQNWAIDQSKEGALYFGNNDGLLVYDETKWDLYPLPNKTVVRSIAVHDRTNRIYVGGQGTFGYFKKDIGGYLQYTSLSDEIQKEEYKNFDDVWKIYIDGSEVIFTTYKMIVRYDEKKPIQIFPAGGQLFEFAFSIRGRLYAFRQLIGLTELNENGDFEPVKDGRAFKDYPVLSILPFEGNKLLLVTQNNGLYTFDGQAIEPWLDELRFFFKKVIINQGELIDKGNYAFATKLGGVIVIEKSGKLIAQINKERGLPNDNVIYLKEDVKTKNLWLGLHNGIALAKINAPWNFVFIPPYTQLGAHSSALYNSKLFLATANGLFFKSLSDVETLGQEFTMVEGTEGEAWSLTKIDNALLLGHHLGAFCMCDNGSVKKIAEEWGYWKFLKIPGHDDLMIGGNYSGLVLFKKSKMSPCGWKKVTKINGFDESSRIMEFDKAGSLYITHVYKGVFKINFSSDYKSVVGETFKHFSEKTGLHGLPSSNKINVFKIDDELIFGTEKGIYRYDPPADSFMVHENFSKIFGDTSFVSFMVQEDQGDIWFVENSCPGILKNMAGKEYERDRNNYPELGFLTNNFKSNFEHINPINKENILFGSADGFFKYGVNPAVDIEQSNPWWYWIAGILIPIILFFVYSLLRKQKTPVIVEEKDLPYFIEQEKEPLSGMTLLIEYAYEIKLKELSENLEKNQIPNLAKIKNDIKVGVSSFEKKALLFKNNQALVKLLREDFNALKPKQLELALCLNNGMNEIEIENVLDRNSGTIERLKLELRDIMTNKNTGNKFTNEQLIEFLRNYPSPVISSLKNFISGQFFHQEINSKSLSLSQLLAKLKNHLSTLPSLEDRLNTYIKNKDWIKNLVGQYKINEPELLFIIIGTRYGLSSNEIAKLLNRERIDYLIDGLKKKFELDSASTDLKDFIQNFN